MNTIEERADRAIYKPTDGHRLKACEVVAFARGYELGATEPKFIDIENACKACENEIQRLKILLDESMGIPSNRIQVDTSLSRIRLDMPSSTE